MLVRAIGWSWDPPIGTTTEPIVLIVTELGTIATRDTRTTNHGTRAWTALRLPLDQADIEAVAWSSSKEDDGWAMSTTATTIVTDPYGTDPHGTTSRNDGPGDNILETCFQPMLDILGTPPHPHLLPWL